jgi:hypothetical protein
LSSDNLSESGKSANPNRPTTQFSEEDKKMGEGVGKMFGIDKIFGGLLDSIGLGALKPLVNIAFDFATGNIPGVLQDLTSLMSSFGDGGFTNNVASRPPLPETFNSEDNEYRTQTNDRPETACACREDNGVSSDRMGELFKLLGEVFSSKDPADMMSKLSDLFRLLSENAEDRQTIQNARTNIQFFAGSSTITA